MARPYNLGHPIPNPLPARTRPWHHTPRPQPAPRASPRYALKLNRSATAPAGTATREVRGAGLERRGEHEGLLERVAGGTRGSWVRPAPAPGGLQPRLATPLPSQLVWPVRLASVFTRRLGGRTQRSAPAPPPPAPPFCPPTPPGPGPAPSAPRHSLVAAVAQKAHWKNLPGAVGERERGGVCTQQCGPQ